MPRQLSSKAILRRSDEIAALPQTAQTRKELLVLRDMYVEARMRETSGTRGSYSAWDTTEPAPRHAGKVKCHVCGGSGRTPALRGDRLCARCRGKKYI